MATYRKKSIELVGKKAICLKRDICDHDLVCSDCRQKYKYKIPLSEDIVKKLKDINTTFCPLCGKEREISIKEVKTNIFGVLAIIAGDVSGKYRYIDIIEDLSLQGYASHVVARNTHQIPISIKELSSMMEVYGLTRIDDIWIDLNFLDKAVISTKETYGGVLEFRDIHFREGRNFIYIDNKKVFRDLIKNKIYLKADLSKMNVEFYEKYYKPYEETMKEKYPEIVLLKLVNEEF